MKTLVNFAGCEDTPCNLDGAKGAMSLCVNMLPSHGSLAPMPILAPCASAKPCVSTTTDDLFPDTANALQLTFGLQRAGAIAIDGKFLVPQHMAAASGNSQGASAPHPSTAADIADCQAASKQIYTALRHAIATQAYAKGLFLHPFLVRYALRLANGQYLWASAPVLMLPNLLPPRLAISSIEAADNGSIISFSPSANPIFQLRCRVTTAIDTSIMQKIAGVDIFATAGIPAYDEENISTLGITSYDNIVDESCGVHRGRSADDPIIGHWSDAADQYRVHHLSDLGYIGDAWHINANTALPLLLASADKFHKIASLSIDALTADSGYFDISLPSSDPVAIAKLPTLDTLQASALRHMPALKLPVSGLTYYAGGHASLPQAQPLASLASARATDANSQACIVAVFVRSGDGKRCAVRSMADCQIANLENDFPRYLYYPHKGAYKMAISIGGAWREVPMTTHPSLDGAFWMGDLGQCEAPAPLSDQHAAALAAEIATASNDIPTPNMLICCQQEQPWHITSAITVGDGGIAAMMPAMKAMSQGQYGEHPIYAFCGNGVWAVGAGACACHQINSDAAVSADAIAAIGQDVAYATPDGVMLLSGSAASCISDKMSAGLGFDTSRLPFWQLIAFKASLPPAFPTLKSLLPECILQCDKEHGLLIVSAPGTDACYVYNPAEKAWAMRLADNCGVIATQPIVLDPHHEACAVSSARVIGDYMPGCTSLILYGSNNLWDWRLMANTDTGCASDMQGQPARYLLAVILSRGARVKYLAINA